MSVTSTGAKNQPQYASSGNPPTFAADLTAAADYAALVGNRKVLTTAQRTALTGKDLWEGLEVYDIDLDIPYTYKSGWVRNIDLADGGWVTPTLGSGWTAFASVRYKVKNGFCYITGGFAKSTYSAAETLFTLPVGARPAYGTYVIGVFSGTLKEVNVSTAGAVTVNQAGTGGVAFSTSFPVA